MRKSISLIASLTVGLGITGCAPSATNALPPIEAKEPWQYYTCIQCGCLDGGCYAKNTIRRTRTKPECQHHWVRISQAVFHERWQKEVTKETLVQNSGDTSTHAASVPTPNR